jgi:light-regulated signal transduction histidine kinase (bacteriophytochrome)
MPIEVGQMKSQVRRIQAETEKSFETFKQIRDRFLKIRETIVRTHVKTDELSESLNTVGLQSKRSRENLQNSRYDLWGPLRKELEQKDHLSKSLKQQVNELERVVQQRTTELQAINQTLMKQTEELIRSNAELERFAYLASHDLREPLRMVSSFTTLLAKRYQGKLGADADDFIRYTIEGVERMEQLIQEVLAYSRVGAPGQQPRRTDLNLLLNRAIENLKTAIEENRAVVTYDPMPTIKVYETELFQLFQNLLANAIKFHGEKPPRVHVWAERKVLPMQEWLFAVQDNGIGIEPEYAERIFDVFKRLHGRDEYPGTGVGLAICKKVVEHHGGRIWVDSKPQQGSTFYFTLSA